MSRGDGFEVADTDSGMLADPKILALARLLHDSTRIGAAVALYDAVRLASWKAGRRLTLEETVPAWWLDPFDDLAAALVTAELIDGEHRIPEHAWQGWFTPAFERRERYRELGRRGGRAKADRGLQPTVERTPQPTVERTLYPVRPTVRPDDSPNPRKRGSRSAGTNPRANGTSPRQQRNGTPEIDRHALQRIVDVLPQRQVVPLTDQVEADTARLEERYAQDPEHWFEGTKS
jgi:hypothetical protein